MLTIDTSELRKMSLARRLLFLVVNWVKEEYRLTCYAHTRWKAEKGDAMAQYSLAAMCESGDRVSQATPEALKWYQKAAFQGVAQAQLALGLKDLLGQGVTRNDVEALLWLRKAAEQGHPEAQYHLGNLYHEGQGTARDLLQASKWYRKAADGGHSAAKICFKELNSARFGEQMVEAAPAKGQAVAA